MMVVPRRVVQAYRDIADEIQQAEETLDDHCEDRGVDRSLGDLPYSGDNLVIREGALEYWL